MRLLILSVSLSVVACAGCEQGAGDDAPSAEQTMAPPKVEEPIPAASKSDSGRIGGGSGYCERRSALGKAQQHAENVVDKAEQAQQDLIEQMDDDGERRGAALEQ